MLSLHTKGKVWSVEKEGTQSEFISEGSHVPILYTNQYK